MAINVDEDDHILYNGQLAENEDKGEESSANQQLSVSGRDRRINAFQIIKNVYPLPLKSNHQIFSIFAALQIFVPCLSWRSSYGQSYCMEA